MKTFDIRKVIKTELVYRYYAKAVSKNMVSFYDQTTNQHVADITLNVVTKTKIVKQGKKKKKKTVFKLQSLVTDLHLVRNEMLDINSSTATKRLQSTIDFTTLTDSDEKELVKELLDARMDEIGNYLCNVFSGNMKMFYTAKNLCHQTYHYFEGADMLFLRTNKPLYDFSDNSDARLLRDTSAVRYNVYVNVNCFNGSKMAMEEGFLDWDKLIGTGKYVGYVTISPNKQWMAVCVPEKRNYFIMSRAEMVRYTALPLPHSDDRYVVGHYEDKKYAHQAMLCLHDYLSKREEQTAKEANTYEYEVNYPRFPNLSIARDLGRKTFNSAAGVIEHPAEMSTDNVDVEIKRRDAVRAALIRHIEGHARLARLYTKFNKIETEGWVTQPRYLFQTIWPLYISLEPSNVETNETTQS